MRHRPLDSLLLAGVGTLVVHEIAYLPGSIGAGVSHDHLPLMWGIGGGVAVAVLLRAVVRSVRHRTRDRAIDPMLLAGAIVSFFTLQEVVEHIVGGSPAISVLEQPVIWLGLVAAPVVGWILARLVNGLVELAAAVEPAPAPVAADNRPATARCPRVLPVLLLRHTLSRRGPPLPAH